jgi:hypothetical protein
VADVPLVQLESRNSRYGLRDFAHRLVALSSRDYDLLKNTLAGDGHILGSERLTMHADYEANYRSETTQRRR